MSVASAVLALVLLFPLVAQPTATAPGTPTQLHLSVAEDPRTSMTVTWVTSGRAASIVEYGLTASYGSRLDGRSHQYRGYAGYIHTVTITSLAPGTRYHYRAGDPLQAWSMDHTFTTALRGAADFTFAATADSGLSDATKQVVERIRVARPAVLLHGGDLSYAEGNQEEWDAWFSLFEAVAADVPFMPSLGNHEREGDLGFSSYLERFALPGIERWYAFTWGDVRFIALDTESPLSPGAEQLLWLERELQQAQQDPSVRWRIVYLHRPVYSSGLSHGSTPILLRIVAPLFERYGVELVIQGHEHNYERTYPVRAGAPVLLQDRLYVRPDAPVYVTVGGGGRSLYDRFDPKDPLWSATRRAAYQYLLGRVLANGTLWVQARFAANDTVFDDFRLLKPSVALPPLPASFTLLQAKLMRLQTTVGGLEGTVTQLQKELQQMREQLGVARQAGQETAGQGAPLLYGLVGGLVAAIIVAVVQTVRRR